LRRDRLGLKELPMRLRLLASFAGVVLLMVVVVTPAGGYIHFPPTTMPKMCQQSTAIRVLTVKKHSKEKGVIIYEAAETFKGKTPEGKVFRHAIGKESKETKPIFDWVADGKQAVMFTIEGGSIACGYVFIDKFCYSVDHTRKEDFWLLIRADPEMAATFHGSVDTLQKVAKDVLAGKDVKVPVDESVKPVSSKEREKRVPGLNEILKKNRGQ
jgi:hypothetical protein